MSHGYGRAPRRKRGGMNEARRFDWDTLEERDVRVGERNGNLVWIEDLMTGEGDWATPSELETK